MAKNDVSTLPGASIPWGRTVEDRLQKVENSLSIARETLDGLGSRVDKTVFATYDGGQNIANGVNGRVELTSPCEVQFVSGSGIFEITVSMGGLVQYGAVLGLGYEGTLWPYEVYFDMPSEGVVGSCDPGDSRWVPLAFSRSTIVTNRPGVYNLSLYIHAKTDLNASSVAYLQQAQLSVKAV